MNRRLLVLLCLLILIEGGVYFFKKDWSQKSKESVPVISSNIIKRVNSSEIINEIEVYGGNVISLEKLGEQHKILVEYISDKNGVEEFITKLTNYNLIEYNIIYRENTYFLKLHLEIR